MSEIVYQFYKYFDQKGGLGKKIEEVYKLENELKGKLGSFGNYTRF